MIKKYFIFTVVLILHLTFTIEHCEAQWEPDVRLTNDPEHSHLSYNNAWCIAVSGNVVHTVWYDLRDGNWEIYYKRSTDGGTNWGADTRLTIIDNAHSESPSIAVNGSIVHVVWQDIRDGYYSEIYYKRSTDGGINWGADTRLTNNPHGKNYASNAVSGSNVHIVWFDYRDGLDGEIYYKLSTDGGITWRIDTRLTNNTAVSKFPSIAVNNSDVHIVWHDDRDGNYEIYYKHSTDGGLNWEADTRLTNNTYSSEYPSIAVSGSVVNVVWEDNRDGNYEIYYKHSTDNGISWGADTRLTNNTAYPSEYPSIAVSGSIVHIVWEDYSDGNWEIYYKRSSDGGINWGSDTRLTDNIAYSNFPRIAVSGPIVHVVWQDERYSSSNTEICYKRNLTGNIGIKNISTEIPSAFSLEQNYPNPFNPVTKIKFDIPKSAYTEIKIYDNLGRDVYTLVSQGLTAGKYEVEWNASNYPSGVYYYKITAGDYSETKKMVLVK
jgi:hypothetical protein